MVMRKLFVYLLSLGHLSVDLAPGALPAILPFLVLHNGLSYTEVAGLMFASSCLSSVVQPAFGYWADKSSKTWFMSLGIVMSGVGLGLSGLASNYWLIFLAVTVCAGVFLLTRPKTYSGIGEVTYTDQDGTYQILTNVSTDRYYPMTEIFQDAGEQESYRFPLRLYINHKNTGADASGMFLQKVKSAKLHIQQDTESSSHAEFSPPQPLKESFPGTALVSYINFNKNCASPTRFIWTLSMENGDTIRLGIDLIITPIQTYHYSAENADLSDSAALQALIDRLAEETSPKDVVNITLPAVSYTEPVVLWGRSFNLTGSEEHGTRTSFPAGIQIRSQTDEKDWISKFTGIDFLGDGTGVGLSTANRAWVQDCRFTNWKTAVLCYGDTWVNTLDCVFEKNGTGLYYNSTGDSHSDTRFTGNQFRENDTAVLLESVPTIAEMNFDGCIFEGNGVDIDNRCGQALGISYAVFQ